MTTKEPSRLYLDYAAAAPLGAAAQIAMQAVMADNIGNPSAIHTEGRRARAYIETARDAVASALVARPEQIVFVSGGTEANNLAIHSAIAQGYRSGRNLHEMKVLTTAIEHPSLLKPLHALAAHGLQVEYVPVTETGEICIPELIARLDSSVVLVAFAYVNSEVGTIQPVRTIAMAVTQYAATQLHPIAIHLDAAQAPFWLPCQWDRLRVTTLALDAGKCGGPLGSGVLVRDRDFALTPLQRGGGQEAGARAGTESVYAIVGVGAAIVDAQATWQTRAKQVTEVRDAALRMCTTILPNAVVNGAYGVARVANNVHLSLPGIDTEYAVVVLDTKGISVSTKSACAGAGSGESLVVRTLTDDSSRARSTLRLTLGPATTIVDMERAFTVLAEHVAKMYTLTK